MNEKIAENGLNFIFGTKEPNALKYFLLKHEDKIGFAFLGRSNVGKSTLVNALFHKKAARTSKTPGRTRQVNVFTFSLSGDSPQSPPLLLIDLPGYGFAKISKEEKRNWNQLMDTFFSYINQNIAMVCLQDARHPNQEADQNFYQYSKDFSLDTFLVFNKIDKLKTQKEKHALKEKLPKVLSQYKKASSVFCVSGRTKTGIQELRDALTAYICKHRTEIQDI